MANEVYHVRMHAIKGDKSQVDIYPKNTPTDVLLGNEDVPKLKDIELKNLDDVLGHMGDLAFKDTNELDKGTSEDYGVVKLTDETNTDTANTALSAAGAKKLNTEVVHKSGDEDIKGVKTFEQLKIQDVLLTYSEKNGDKVLDISFGAQS